MQINGSNPQEQAEIAGNAFKAMTKQFSGNFLSFMKDIEIGSNTNASEDFASSKQEVKQSSTETEKPRQNNTKDDKEVSSKDEAKPSKKDDTTADVDKSDNSIDKETNNDEIGLNSNTQAEDTQNKPAKEADVQTKETSVNGPSTAQQQKVQASGSEIVQANNQQGEIFADPKSKIEQTIPTTGKIVENNGLSSEGEVSLQTSSANEKLSSVSGEVEIKDFKKIMDTPVIQKNLLQKTSQQNLDGSVKKELPLLAQKVSANAVASNQPIVNADTQTVIDTTLPMSEDVLKQAEFISNKINVNTKTPVKISVDVVKPEMVQSSISQETLSVLNKDMEVKFNQNDNNNIKVAKADVQNSSLTDAFKQVSDVFTNNFSSVAKIAREQILGVPSEQAQTKDADVKLSDIGLGQVSSENLKTTSSSADSEGLALGKTFNIGKSVAGKANTSAKAQLPMARQVVDQIKVQIKQSNISDKITVKLNPKELGQVELKVEISKSGSMNVEITANKKETLDLLKQDVKYLEKALQETVAKSESTPNFTFNLKGDGGQNQANQGQADRQESQNQNSNQQASNDNGSGEEQEKPAEYKRSGISIKV